MSRSNKARYGTKCKHRKDTVLASRSQVRYTAKVKKRRSRLTRRTSKEVSSKIRKSRWTSRPQANDVRET